LVALIITVCW